MSTRTKTIVVIIATLLIGIAIGALATGALREKRAKHIEAMLPGQRFLRVMERIIQPTPEQRATIEGILKKRSDQIGALNEEYQGEIRAVLDSLHSELDAVLTPEQKSRLEKRLARGDKEWVEMRIARLTKELNLTEKQQGQIRKIMDRMQEDMEAEHQEFKGNWRQHRKVLKERIAKLHKEIEAILTPEQREKYRKLREEMGPPFEHGPRPPFEGGRKPPFEDGHQPPPFESGEGAPPPPF